MSDEPLDNTLPYPPLDESQDRELRIQTGPQTSPPRVSREPDDPDEAARMPPPNVPQTPDPWSPNNLKASYIVGTGDSYLGKVGYSYDAAADKVLDQKGTIDVRRVGFYRTDAGLSKYGEIPPPLSSPNPGLAKAIPLPCVDQEAYHVAQDDPVLVITGRDGRQYYIPDTKPFIGVVTTSGSTKEANFGGAGNTTIHVTRQIMSGDPTATAPTLGNTSVTYDCVFPLVNSGQHHGYRVGDKVLCFRRGMYMFCLPARGVYHCKVIATGPAAEADFADEHYWLSVGTANIAYTGDTNVWDWSSDNTELFKIQGANIAERTAGTHKIKTDGTIYVIATLFADSATSKAPYLVFSHGGASDATETNYNTYAAVAHYAEYGAGATRTFYTKDGFLNSAIEIGIDVRYCEDQFTQTGAHPGYRLPAKGGGPILGVTFGNLIFSRSGSDSAWIDLAYSSMDATGGTVAAGESAISRLAIQAKVTTGGQFQLQVVDSGTGFLALDITFVIRRTTCPTIYVGTQIEFGDNTCHEGILTPPNTWGDGIWTPGS